MGILASFLQLAPSLQGIVPVSRGTTCLGVALHFVKVVFVTVVWLCANPESAIASESV
jgi:hypothetical protein